MKLTVEFDDNGAVRDIAYEGRANLTTDEIGNMLACVLGDTLGDEPKIGDVIAIQGAMARALQGT